MTKFAVVFLLVLVALTSANLRAARDEDVSGPSDESPNPEDIVAKIAVLKSIIDSDETPETEAKRQLGYTVQQWLNTGNEVVNMYNWVLGG